MNRNKTLLLAALCVALALAGGVLGTLAWLSDRDSVTNTFTVGSVNITLDETKVNTNGDPLNADNKPVEEDEEPARTGTGNTYKLLPGKVYLKDPTVTVEPGSVESHLRMVMTVHNAPAVQAILDEPAHGLTDYADLLVGWKPEVWRYNGFVYDEEAGTISFEFRYHETVTGGAEALPLEPLFTGLQVPGTVTGAELKALQGGEGPEDDFRIVVTAHAVQAAALDGEDAAWSAFNQQLGWAEGDLQPPADPEP